MPTIYEIAKAAGVSPGTVSKVFNNYDQINEKTKEKVMSVANDMGYMPNITAQSLKTKQSFLVGVVFSENVGIGLNHHYFSRILEEFRHRIGEYGYDTIFINNTYGDRKIGYLEHCKYRNVDAAFIITALSNEINMMKLLESKIKCVTTDMVVESTPFVMSNNEEGGRLAVHHLYEKGHRRIGQIAGPLNEISAGERFKGYEQGLKDVGLKFKQDWLIESQWSEATQAYDITLKYLDRFTKKTMPTAIFVSSDIMSLAVIKALKTKGYKVPEDVSIIGFDDIEVASLVTPALTTIRQNTDQIGRQVADVLYRLIQGEEVGVIPRIPVELIARETVMDISK